MELPISVVFEPPSQVELRALLRRRRMWVAAAILALVIGLVLVVVGVSRAEAHATAGSVVLTVSSRPAGAVVSVDGQQRGRTPAQLTVARGQHRVAFRSDTVLDAEYTLEATDAGAELEAILWRREPSLRRLRPSLPGAALDSVVQLHDGRLGLVTRASSEAEMHAWRLDPRDGEIEPISAGLSGSRLAVAADGARLAYVGRDVGPSATPFAWLDSRRPAAAAGGVVWRVADGQRAHAAPSGVWRAPLGETLVDVSWSPLDDVLLAVTAAELPGGALRSRLWAVHADGGFAPRSLLTLPSAVVPGAYAWSPDGQHVVLVAHAGALNALCLLDLDGGFRYLADLDPSAVPPLPYPAVAWSADSRRVVFVAPGQQPTSPGQKWLAAAPRRAVYEASIDAADPRLIAEVDAEALAWREDGSILLASRRRDDSALRIQVLDSGGQTHDLLQVPLSLSPRYAAAWDTRSGQLLVADAAGVAGPEFWLIGLSLEPPA